MLRRSQFGHWSLANSPTPRTVLQALSKITSVPLYTSRLRKDRIAFRIAAIIGLALRITRASPEVVLALGARSSAVRKGLGTLRAVVLTGNRRWWLAFTRLAAVIRQRDVAVGVA